MEQQNLPVFYYDYKTLYTGKLVARQKKIDGILHGTNSVVAETKKNPTSIIVPARLFF
jgi:hypothetical protein